MTAHAVAPLVDHRRPFRRRRPVIARRAPSFAGATPLAGEPWSPETAQDAREVNAFVVVDPDNSILLRIAKSEMGQGVMTSLAMIVAEELECDFAKVKVEYASANRNLIDGDVYQLDGDRRLLLGAPFARVPAAGGRLGARRGSSPPRRRAGASRPPPASPAAASSGMRPPAARRPYGELAARRRQGLARRRSRRSRRPISSSSSARALRASTRRSKSTGAAKFGIDTRLPGMVYAAVANCPVFGGKLKSYDEAAIKDRRGFIAVVPVENGVAVVADSFWRAKEALAALPIVWDFGAAASTDSDEFRAEYRAALDGPLANGGGRGDVAAAFAKPAKIVEARLRGSASRACADGAAERDRALAPRPHRRLDGHAGCRRGARARGEGGRRRSAQCLHPQLFPRRRVRPARGQRRIAPGGAGLQGRRQAGQAGLDARAGHPARSLPPAGGVAAARRRSRADGMPTAFDFRTAVGSITRSLGWGRPRTASSRRRSRACPTFPIAPTR